jgi:hypothetical protein
VGVGVAFAGVGLSGLYSQFPQFSTTLLYFNLFVKEKVKTHIKCESQTISLSNKTYLDIKVLPGVNRG